MGPAGTGAHLHRRAAEAQAVPERAIAHYLAGEWWDEAARQIMQVGEQVLQQGAVRRLRSWIEALPVEVRRRQPRLGYWLGVSMWAMGQFDAAHGLLEEASEAFAAAGDGAGQSEALVFLADCRTWMVDFTGAREATEKALRCPISPHMEVQLRCVRARSAFFQGDAPAVIADLEAAITVVETTRDERAVHELARGYTPDFAVLPGGMQRSERFCRLVTAHLGQTISPLHAAVALHNSFAFLWRGMWEEALREGERALAISDQFGGLFWVDAEIERMLPICHVLRGDEQSAEHAFETLFHHLEQPAMAAYARPAMASYLYLVGRVRWLQGRLDDAREIYARMRAAEYPHECVFAPYFRTLMRGLLEMNDAQYPNAECSFREAVALQSRQPFTVALSNARLLLAYLFYRWGREEEALAELAPLLEEREQQNAPGFIMWEAAPVVVPLLQLAVQRGVHPEFAAHVLELLGANAEAAQDPQAASLVDTAEALTPREVEVLRLLAQGHSNQAIAQDLVVAVGTVKRHVNSIMSKLHVESRLQAVARARDLDLV